MRYSWIKNLKNLDSFVKKECLSVFYKGLFFNLNLVNFLRSYFFFKLVKLNIRFTHLKNRCFFNYSSKGLIKRYRLSRHIFKYFANYGFVPGLIRK